MIQDRRRRETDSSALEHRAGEGSNGGATLSLLFRLCLGQTNHSLALFELPALFHNLHALESLQHAALGFDCALALQAWMLTHGAQNLDEIAGKATQIASSATDIKSRPLTLETRACLSLRSAGKPLRDGRFSKSEKR